MSTIVKKVLIGLGATFAIDCWTSLLNLFGIHSHGTRFLGRWLAYLPEGKYFHHTIIQTAPAPNELVIGMIAHYGIGICCAFLLTALYGKGWLNKPGIIPAMVIAMVTLVAPIFILQPALGFGIAFSNMPQQGILLIKISIIHLVYGFGLYLSSSIVNSINNKFYFNKKVSNHK